MVAERSRLIWRCRRGIREMDIILQDFLNRSYDALDDQDQAEFSHLLNEQDLDILNWITGKDEPDSPGLKRIVSIIRESVHRDTARLK